MASNGIRDRVAIIGMGCTPFGEHWDKGADDLLVDSATAAVASETTIPSPPFDQSTCWYTRGMTRVSLRSPSRNSGIMSSVAHPTWSVPAA